MYMIVSMNDCTYMYVYEFKDYIAIHQVCILLPIIAEISLNVCIHTLSLCTVYTVFVTMFFSLVASSMYVCMFVCSSVPVLFPGL